MGIARARAASRLAAVPLPIERGGARATDTDRSGDRVGARQGGKRQAPPSDRRKEVRAPLVRRRTEGKWSGHPARGRQRKTGCEPRGANSIGGSVLGGGARGCGPVVGGGLQCKYFQCTVLDASHDTMSARQSLTLPNTRRQGIGRMRMPGLGGRVKRSCQRIGQHETLGQPNLPERGQVHGLWNRNAPNGRRQGRDRGTDVGVRNCKAEAWAASFSAQWCGTRHWAVSVPTTRAARSQERQGRAKVRHFPVGRAPGTLPQCGEWM